MDYHVVFTGNVGTGTVNGSFQVTGAGPLRPELIRAWEKMLRDERGVMGVVIANVIRLDPAPEGT